MGALRLFPKIVVASTVLASVALAIPLALPSQAQNLLEEAGTITPAEATYTFDGQTGQAITITLSSNDFDPVLSLLDSTGSEIANNDDFGGSLNSTIILELPADDTYTVVAKSFSGQGGSFDLMVRNSTPYETSLAKAQTLALAEDYNGAIAAYTEAIGIDPNQPSGYLGRAEAYLGQVYLEQGDQVQGPSDIPVEARNAIIADFEKAAELIEVSGPQDWADSLRQQAEYLRTGSQEESSTP